MADSYEVWRLSGLAAPRCLKNKRGGRLYRRCKKYILEDSMTFRQEKPPRNLGP
jgi:hypothetical protein